MIINPIASTNNQYVASIFVYGEGLISSSSCSAEKGGVTINGVWTSKVVEGETKNGFLINDISDYGDWTITAYNGLTYSFDLYIDSAGEYVAETKTMTYFTEQELISMGCQISRTIGDKISSRSEWDAERYIKRIEDNPYILVRGIFDSSYIGYVIISNSEITEQFVTSSYGGVDSCTGNGLDAYAKRMSSAIQQAYNSIVYLNNDSYLVTYEVRLTGNVINNDFIDIVNKMARSIQLL